MILPDQFWREFDECQVPFLVLADSVAGANSVAEALRGRVEVREKEVLNSKQALESRVLRLAWDGAAPSQLSSMDVVVISGPTVLAGGRVRMLVTMPVSKFDLDDDLRAAFKGAISATCGGFDVVLEDVADKPRDFKGGGPFHLLQLPVGSKGSSECCVPCGIRLHHSACNPRAWFRSARFESVRAGCKA